LNTQTAMSIILKKGTDVVSIDYSFSNEDKAVTIAPSGGLDFNADYTISISDALKGAAGESFSAVEIKFRTVDGEVTVVSWTIGGNEVPASGRITDAPLDLSALISFSAPLDPQSVTAGAVTIAGKPNGAIQASLSEH